MTPDDRSLGRGTRQTRDLVEELRVGGGYMREAQPDASPIDLRSRRSNVRWLWPTQNRRLDLLSEVEVASQACGLPRGESTAVVGSAAAERGIVARKGSDGDPSSDECPIV